jgi:hypothetical protein
MRVATIAMLTGAMLTGTLIGSASARVLDGPTGEALFTACRSNRTTDLVCNYVLRGFIDRIKRRGEKNVCLPDHIKFIQAKIIILRYLETHRKFLSMPAILLVQMALEEAFPCQRFAAYHQ